MQFNSFFPKLKVFPQDFLNRLLGQSLTILLQATISTFVVVFIFQVLWYGAWIAKLYSNFLWTVFSYAIAIVVAYVFQSARLALGITGVREWSNKEYYKGVYGVLCSVAFVVYELYFEIGHLSADLGSGNEKLTEYLRNLLVFMVLLGLFLEIRMAVAIQPRPTTVKLREKRITGKAQAETDGGKAPTSSTVGVKAQARKAALAFIQQYYSDYGELPKAILIAEKFNVHRATANRYINSCKRAS